MVVNSFEQQDPKCVWIIETEFQNSAGHNVYRTTIHNFNRFSLVSWLAEPRQFTIFTQDFEVARLI